MDSKHKNILYMVGGAALLYLLFRKSDDGTSDTGGSSSSGSDLNSLFGSGLKNPGKQAMLVDTRAASPVVSPAGKALMSPAPETEAEYMPADAARLVQSHLNWFFDSLKQKGAEGVNAPKLARNGQADANTLKAFWLWLNILWRARYIVGDDVLLGHKVPHPSALGYGFLKGLWSMPDIKPEKSVYIPTSDIMGSGRPEDYTIYRLYSQSDPNLTGAFSNKLINHMQRMVGVAPTPRDWEIIKAAYDNYRENPKYVNSPPPYPKSWPQ